MLDYIDRAWTISVIRPQTEPAGTSVPLGFISKHNFQVSINAGVSVSDEERQEIQTVADCHKAVEASLLQGTALKLSETMTRVMGYYERHASELERHLIRLAIQGAVRRLRRSHSLPERRKPLVPNLPTPAIMAGILYDALAKDSRCEVSGNPRRGEMTYLVGQWNLDEMASELLSTIKMTEWSY